MAKIIRVEMRMSDLVPKVKRVDAIQSFVSQETPIVTITLIATGQQVQVIATPSVLAVLRLWRFWKRRLHRR